MLMMRLQRVGRRNDPSYRIVVTDKRTGPKSDKHVDRLGSYNPKLNHIQLDAEKAQEWLAKGVQPSDTMHNLLVSEKVIEGKKKNVLPKKSPIIKEAEAESEASAEAVEDTVTEASTDAEETEESTKEEEVKEAEKAEVEEVSEEEPATDDSESGAEEKEEETEKKAE